MNLMKFKPVYFLLSLTVLIPGLISLITFGLKPAIDFTGGSLLAVQFSDQAQLPNTQQAQQLLAPLYQLSSVQASEENQLILRGKQLSNEQKEQVLAKLGSQYGPVTAVRFAVVGPALGQELLIKTLTAVVIVAGLIMLYVWKQFQELKYGVCAILAMFHDSLVLLGSFSLLGYFWGIEVDVLFVTALLTTLSFSIHDTIVVYDRIRELKQKNRQQDLAVVANTAVLETLSRSINNSVTIVLMLLALVLLGGTTIRWFAVALLIGAITGTYSSTFTAVPLLLLWENKLKKR
ncbi:MAG: protein translocase subunit SecF [Candidatus Pacebacteria bacterium]|nr:protein translocase subunit SecF [Candidatus Paceibacterota bacterium]